LDAGLIGALVGLVGAGAGACIALYAMGFFQYLGGKKKSALPSVSKQVLIDKILALNDPSRPYRIVRGTDTDLVAEWKIADAEWYGIFNKNGLRESYRAFLLLDEIRHSVRCCEELGSVSWTTGLDGLIPIVSFKKSFFRGRILYSKEYAKGYGLKQLAPPEAGKVYDYKFDVGEIRGPIILTVEDNGWEWVPVTALRHATYRQLSIAQQNRSSYCAYCKAKLETDATYCVTCGREVSS
jgi:hypothetical protein